MSDSKNWFNKRDVFLMHDGQEKELNDIRINDTLMSPTGNPITITDIIEKNKNYLFVQPVKGENYVITPDSWLTLKVSMAPGYYESKTNAYILCWLQEFKYMSKIFSVYKYGTKAKALKAVKLHMKNVLDKDPKCSQYGDIVTIKAGDYQALPNKVKRLYKGYSSGIEFDDEVEFDTFAYALGYWLGDGTSANTGITTADPEIVAYYKKFAEDIGNVFNKIGKDKYAYRISSGLQSNDAHGKNIFLNFLKDNNLIKNKHIPDQYKFDSRENRLSLLAGIIDSDGHLGNGYFEITLKSKKLADDTVFLARSLGFKAFCKQVQKTCTNGKNGPVTGTYYRFNIYGEGLEQIPTLLKRKQAAKRQQIKNAAVTGLQLYKGDIKIPCYQLVTDSDEMLMLNDFTIVHK